MCRPGGAQEPWRSPSEICQSGRPADRPIVDARFLNHPDDVKALAFGIDLAREIGNSAAMSAFVKREVAPGQKLTGQDMENFV